MNEPSFWRKLRYLVGRPPQPSPKPVPPLNSPSPPSWQTAEASKHLATAQQYLLNITEDIPDHREVAREKFLRTLEAATKYIQKARELDPDATCNFTNPKTKEVSPRTLDDLARHALYLEGRTNVDWSRYPDEVRRGLQALLKAYAYDPYRSGVCAHSVGGIFALATKRTRTNT